MSLKHHLFSKMAFLAVIMCGPLCSSHATATPLNIEKASYNRVQSPLGVSRIFAICMPADYNKADALISATDWDGFGERDLVVLEMQDKAASLVTFEKELNLNIRSKFHNNFTDSNIRSIVRCGKRLEFVLIGKDQTVKQRWNNVPSFDTLYSIIDAMPMRRFEMRQQKENN